MAKTPSTPAPTGKAPRKPVPFGDRVALLPTSVLKGRSAQHLAMVVKIAALPASHAGAVVWPIDALEALLGIKRRRLRDLIATGPLSDAFSLPSGPDRDHRWFNDEDVEFWIIEKAYVLHDDDGTVQGQFLRVPHSLLYANTHYKPRAISDGALWAWCAVTSVLAGRPAGPVSINGLTNWSVTDDFPKGLSASTVAAHLAAAEDEGIISTIGDRSGRTVARRTSHPKPLPKKDRTRATRATAAPASLGAPERPRRTSATGSSTPSTDEGKSTSVVPSARPSHARWWKAPADLPVVPWLADEPVAS